MPSILVVANQTLGGASLLATVREHTARYDDVEVFVVVPQSRPSHGRVIYDEAVRDAAQVRIDLAAQFLADESWQVAGEVGDPDPYQATMDAVAEHRPDEIIISTLPATSSGWLRRDLIERIQASTEIPVAHVVVDLEQEGLPFTVTLVVANRTAGADALVGALRAKNVDGAERVFIAVVPQPDGHGAAAGEARSRLRDTLDAYRDAGLVCAGMIGDPDPYTATMNALSSFRVDEVVVSTLPEEKSGWLRSDLIQRIRGETPVPVEHVISDLAGVRA